MKEAIPVLVSRENELTDPMHMIDHTCARLDGPPPMPVAKKKTTYMFKRYTK